MPKPFIEVTCRDCPAKFKKRMNSHKKLCDSCTRKGVLAIPLEEVLVENSTYSRYNLKKRLLKAGFMPYVCGECGRGPEWNGKPLTLVLDHKNGVNNDNRAENLRYLCPNCNSQMPTFAGRNIGRYGPREGRAGP